jgi:hypothetical protein
MNFNLIVKTAVATTLLSAVSIPAFATIVTPPASGPTPVPGMGAGGLIVEVWDTQTGHSLSEWLGGDTTTFGGPAATGGVSDYGILGGSAFASTFSSSEVAAGNVQFVVEAANAATATPTVDITVSTLGKVTGSGVSTVAGHLTSGISGTMNGATACANVNPCIALNGASDPNFAVTTLGTTAMGATKTSGLAGGAALDFYQVVSTGSALGTQTLVQFASAVGAATWTLSATGDLEYSVPTSPVPLPAAVWLLGSGLLGLLGVGRRKVLAA